MVEVASAEGAADELEVLEEAGGVHKTRYRLETALALRRHAVRIYSEMRSGKLDALDANRQIRVLSAIGEINQALDVERRLRKLEQIEETRRRSTRR